MLIRTVIIGAATAFLIANASEELIKNGGFEEYDAETSRFFPFEFSKKMDRYRTSFFSQTEPGKSGKYALKAVGLKGHPYNRYGMVMEQKVERLSPGVKYTLSFWAKGKGTPAPEKFAAVELCQLRANGKSICYNTVKIDLSAAEWKFYSLTFPVQQETRNGVLRIVTRNLGSDDAFFVDDISLKQSDREK